MECLSTKIWLSKNKPWAAFSFPNCFQDKMEIQGKKEISTNDESKKLSHIRKHPFSINLLKISWKLRWPLEIIQIKESIEIRETVLWGQDLSQHLFVHLRWSKCRELNAQNKWKLYIVDSQVNAVGSKPRESGPLWWPNWTSWGLSWILSDSPFFFFLLRKEKGLSFGGESVFYKA